MALSFKIGDLPKDLRPREKALLKGVTSLSNQELLMLVLRHGVKGAPVGKMAQDLLIACDNLRYLADFTIYDLMQIQGIKQAKALELLAIMELSKRVKQSGVVHESFIDHPQKIIDWLQEEIGFQKQECFLVVYLNVQAHIIYHEILFKGTLDRSIFHPREIFNRAVVHHAASLICVHNHPAGSLQPSQADIMATKQLLEASRLMQIPLLDHLIVTQTGYCSILSYLD